MKKKSGYLTKLEKKAPLGKIVDGLSSHQIVERLKEMDFLTEDEELTRRGTEYVTGVLEKLDSVERIMVEKFILEHHQLTVKVEYEK